MTIEFPMLLSQKTPLVAHAADLELGRGSDAFQRVFRAVGEQVDRGERLMRGAVSGVGPSSARELIALQAGIYRYTELVDLTTKFVDRAASAVRTTLQSGG